MSLTLEEVRNKRFHNAGPDNMGYATRDVDEFVDRVEDLVADLTEAKAHLETQVNALQAAEAPVSRVEVTAGKEASSAVIRLVEMATEQSERLVTDAVEEAAQLRAEATREAEEVRERAIAQARQVEADANSMAEQTTGAATARATELDRETEERRAEMQQTLAQERDALVVSIQQLRAYESAYRDNLAAYLRRQLEQLENKAEPTDLPIPTIEPIGSAEPNGRPELTEAGTQDEGVTRPAASVGGMAAEDEDTLSNPGLQPVSDTPRLDALLSERR